MLSLFSLPQPGSAWCLHHRDVATATDRTSQSASGELDSESLEMDVKQSKSRRRGVGVDVQFLGLFLPGWRVPTKRALIMSSF